MRILSNDALATLLLTSNLIKQNEVKAFTLLQWNKLARQIKDSTYKSPAELFNKSSQAIMNDLFLDKETADRIVVRLGKAELIVKELEALNSLGISVVTRADSDYPRFLRTRLKEQAPSHFFYSGNIESLTKQAIGMVGSRNADEESLEFTRRFVNDASNEGFAVVSGGAKGVDITAQEEAIKSGGFAISYLHSDLEKWVRKKEIRKQIDEDRLILLSSVEPRARFQGYNAMARNKYIYCQSKATVVVASSTSGGTWEGAKENIKYKWVPILVREANKTLEGNRALLEVNSNNPYVRALKTQLKYDIKALLLEYDFEHINSFQTKKSRKNSYDAFNLVAPSLKELMLSNKSNHEICNELNVNLEQVNIWVERVNNELIRKNSNPEVIQDKLF
ncbi:DNA-processing protein DprA [Paenibacillus xylanexedens]|uniref:DNA-processing protein DprA n=1 Tax=Paenibacillus xylanexedens TaxID=528191 RepID=UPI001C92CF9F|nr:DNA-processing protein DprA [Paenibacillus xylanexedens]